MTDEELTALDKTVTNEVMGKPCWSVCIPFSTNNQSAFKVVSEMLNRGFYAELCGDSVSGWRVWFERRVTGAEGTCPDPYLTGHARGESFALAVCQAALKAVRACKEVSGG